MIAKPIKVGTKNSIKELINDSLKKEREIHL